MKIYYVLWSSVNISAHCILKNIKWMLGHSQNPLGVLGTLYKDVHMGCGKYVIYKYLDN